MQKILFLFFILNCSILSGQETQAEKNNVTLNYAYQLGESYKYKKITNRDSEVFYSYISIQPLNTMTNGDTWYEFLLDSCNYFYKEKLIRATRGKDLENAKINILYSKFGALLKINLLNQKRNEYIQNSNNNSDDERFFELPINPIGIGETWTTKKIDESDFYHTKNKNLNNILTGIESKNGYECYRINFSGNSADVAKQGDYTQTDNGVINGSIWIDIERRIVIAIESEVMIQNSKAKHPGFSGNAPIKASSYRTSVEFIE